MLPKKCDNPPWKCACSRGFRRIGGVRPRSRVRYTPPEAPASRSCPADPRNFPTPTNPTAQPCVPDLNGDGAVGAPDIAILLGDWGAFGSSSDLDGDNVVGPADLAVLLSAWGECP